MRMSLKLIPYLFVEVFILIIIGVGNLFTAGWSIDRLLSASFWFDYATLTVCTVLSFFSWANLRVDVLTSYEYHLDMEKDPKTNLNHLGVIVAIKQHTISALVLKHRKPDIKYYIVDINMVEKTKRFEYNISRKIAKIRSSRAFMNPRKFEKLQHKIDLLESYLTPEWISANIKSAKVKYAVVTESYLVNGVALKTKEDFRPRVDTKAERMFKDNIYRWILSLSYLLLLTSVAFDLVKDLSWSVVFAVVIKVGNCVYQSVAGAAYANKYIKDKVIYELDDRISIIENYIDWQNKREVN